MTDGAPLVNIRKTLARMKQEVGRFFKWDLKSWSISRNQLLILSIFPLKRRFTKSSTKKIQIGWLWHFKFNNYLFSLGDGDGCSSRGGRALSPAGQAEGQVEHAERYAESHYFQQQFKRILHIGRFIETY
jgi:hypothetical protein